MYYKPVLIWLALLVFILGCGKSSNPVTQPPGQQPFNFHFTGGRNGSRQIMYTASVVIDTQSGEVQLLGNRGATSHWNLTNWLNPPSCAECIDINILDIQADSNFIKIGVGLTNPSSIAGYDVRGIMMTNVDGFMLVNADGYTELWDDGGDVTLNPFKAYAVDQLQREFAGNAQHTMIYAIRYPAAIDLLTLTLVVDASWPGNCEEPYYIGNFKQSGPLYNDGTPVDIELTVLDWQGDVSSVQIDLTPIGGGIKNLEKTGFEIWGTSIHTGIGINPALYILKVVASTEVGSGILNKYIKLIINPAPVTPVNGPVWQDYTYVPGELNDICIQDNIAYIAAGIEGLYLIDLDTEPPAITGFSNNSNYVNSVTVDSKYAYTGGYFSGIDVYNITDTYNPIFTNNFGQGWNTALSLNGNKLYAADVLSKLRLFEIDGEANGALLDSITIPSIANVLLTVDDFVFAACGSSGLLILDASDPGDIQTLYTYKQNDYHSAYGVDVSGDLAYVVGANPGLVELDINDKANPQEIGNSNYGGFDIAIHDTSAVVASESNGLRLFDITQQGYPMVSAGLPGKSLKIGLDSSGEYAYIPLEFFGLARINITNTGSLHEVSKAVVPKCRSSVALGDYIYSFSYDGELFVHNISDPANPVHSATVPLSGYGVSIACSGSLIACGNLEGVVELIDLSAGDNPVVLANMELHESVNSLIISGDYIYAATGQNKIRAIDISETSAPVCDWELSMPGKVYDLALNDLYLIASLDSSQICPIDITELPNPVIGECIDTAGEANSLIVSGDYCYVADGTAGVSVFDITDPMSPLLVASEPLPGIAWTIEVSRQTLLTACLDAGIQVLSLNDMSQPELICSGDIYRDVYNVLQFGNLIITSDDYCGCTIYTVD